MNHHIWRVNGAVYNMQHRSEYTGLIKVNHLCHQWNALRLQRGNTSPTRSCG
jgi:hypothetical protein